MGERGMETPLPDADDDHGFPGCKPMRISREEIDCFEGRFEFWDAETEIALACESIPTYHELPRQRLIRVTGIVQMYRGSPIELFGAADLRQSDRFGKPRRILQADQTVYLHPERDGPRGPYMMVGEPLPDVVLEVDYITDARCRKLGLYQSWGFQEVWVEVPDVESPERASPRAPGLTIHVAGPDGFAEAPASRAFPTLTAEEIHLALNEDWYSAATVAALRRVGLLLGEREGTTPADDPTMRHLAAHRFGAETAARLAEADSDLLDDIADWLVEGGTGREPRDRVAKT